MPEATSQYAELVYLRRIVRKVPSSDMAKTIGVSTETYLRSERGEREFTLLEAMKIANKLRMPISYVFPKIFELDVANSAT
ncbi:helix-turn-helix transcriptional regulator [Cohnella sp. AR92]|uniref:helix-turn-helix transcriptional regulator n=1 Tax=Cohnella sp. AR92 TaxID=648716 RepID=UPI000F8EA6AE|nr:helix-turn-helix domain-containing protein [Cohnella sp. AR92]RUS43589.1 helix-turn-helix domain-containing protein [Cohnella sp. AR92]